MSDRPEALQRLHDTWVTIGMDAVDAPKALASSLEALAAGVPADEGVLHLLAISNKQTELLAQVLRLMNAIVYYLLNERVA